MVSQLKFLKSSLSIKTGSIQSKRIYIYICEQNRGTSPPSTKLGLGVWSSGFGIWGLGFGIRDIRSGVGGLLSGICGLEFETVF